jgi:hypothetical protein
MAQYIGLLCTVPVQLYDCDRDAAHCKAAEDMNVLLLSCAHSMIAQTSARVIPHLATSCCCCPHSRDTLLCEGPSIHLHLPACGSTWEALSHGCAEALVSGAWRLCKE